MSAATTAGPTFTVHPVQIGHQVTYELRGPAGDGLGQFISRDTAQRMADAHNRIAGSLAS